MPLFAILYRILTDIISRLLARKHLPLATAEYAGVDHIDEQTGQPVRRVRVRTDGMGDTVGGEDDSGGGEE